MKAAQAQQAATGNLADATEKISTTAREQLAEFKSEGLKTRGALWVTALIALLALILSLADFARKGGDKTATEPNGTSQSAVVRTTGPRSPQPVMAPTITDVVAKSQKHSPQPVAGTQHGSPIASPAPSATAR